MSKNTRMAAESIMQYALPPIRVITANGISPRHQKKGGQIVMNSPNAERSLTNTYMIVRNKVIVTVTAKMDRA